MPRPKKPARLWQNKQGDWIILDSGKQTRTGHRGSGGRQPAEEALARYLSRRLALPSSPQSPQDVPISVVLANYLENLPEEVLAPERQAYAVKALAPFWGAKTCGDVVERNCRDYVRWRQNGDAEKHSRKTISATTARRELGTLRAALKKALSDGIITGAPAVWMPPKGNAKPDWLSRDEFAKLLWELWRNKRSRHAARLALCQFYTGSRPGTVAKTTWERRADGPWVDLISGIWWRSGEDELSTVKARRPHGIPTPLLSHLRRWHRIYGGTYIAEYARNPNTPVGDIGGALERAAERAGIKRITPHTLKHTAITLAIQGGMTAEDAADYFSTSIEIGRAHV